MSAFQTKVKKEYEKKGYTVLKIIKLSDSSYPKEVDFRLNKRISLILS